MPSILKRFADQTPDAYEFPEVAELAVEDAPIQQADAPPEGAPAEAPVEKKPPTPIDYARVQADAILEDAHREAEEIRQEARQAAQEEMKALRQEARAEGYNRGFAEGMARAMSETKEQREQQAVSQARDVKDFMESAARARDQLMEEVQEDLKELALTIAEKVIRVSLRSSGDILLRMIENATERHKRREWAHIYIAGCDAKTLAYTIPELTAALSHVSDRVRIIPMADDESGTCIIELPDEIIDASVSTQLGNIREVLSDVRPDRDGE